jgi:preprotein translocase subunit Sec61beta
VPKTTGRGTRPVGKTENLACYPEHLKALKNINIGMVKLIKGKRTHGPSSSVGIMRFFDVESKAPKISYFFVLAATALFVLAVLFLKIGFNM